MVFAIGLLTSQCQGFIRVFFFTRQEHLEQGRLDFPIQYALHLHQQKRLSSCSNGLFISISEGGGGGGGGDGGGDGSDGGDGTSK